MALDKENIGYNYLFKLRGFFFSFLSPNNYARVKTSSFHDLFISFIFKR